MKSIDSVTDYVSVAWIEEFGGGLPGTRVCSCDECLGEPAATPTSSTSLVASTFALTR